jgi:hypothetical protein
LGFAVVPPRYGGCFAQSAVFAPTYGATTEITREPFGESDKVFESTNELDPFDGDAFWLDIKLPVAQVTAIVD